MIRHLYRCLKKSERGASLIEFAIVLPILLALIFGIIEFAWILNGHIILTGAAREGVRIAVVSNHSDKSQSEIRTEVKQAVINRAITFELAPEDIEVKFGNYMEETSVEIEVARLPLLIGFFPFIGNFHEIKDVKATMMHE